jgi:hypothetical protein
MPRHETQVADSSARWTAVSGSSDSPTKHRQAALYNAQRFDGRNITPDDVTAACEGIMYLSFVSTSHAFSEPLTLVPRDICLCFGICSMTYSTIPMSAKSYFTRAGKCSSDGRDRASQNHNICLCMTLEECLRAYIHSTPLWVRNQNRSRGETVKGLRPHGFHRPELC